MIVAKFLGVAVPKQSEEKFRNPENTEFELLKLARQLGMKAKTGKFSIRKMDKLTVPVIAEKKDGEFIIILNRQEQKWVILDPKNGNPEAVQESELMAMIKGSMFVFGKKGSKGEDEPRKFGFRWFIPTILKFKKQFITVLVAVFVIQVFGILTPLMTQVVVDKVLSHHAISTLHTIAVGILIVYLYELII